MGEALVVLKTKWQMPGRKNKPSFSCLAYLHKHRGVLFFWQEKQAISFISGLSTQAQRSLISQHFSNVHSLCGFLILCPPESQKFLIFADDPFTEKKEGKITSA